MLGTEGDHLRFVITPFQEPSFPPGAGSPWSTLMQEAEEVSNTKTRFEVLQIQTNVSQVPSLLCCGLGPCEMVNPCPKIPQANWESWQFLTDCKQIT